METPIVSSTEDDKQDPQSDSSNITLPTIEYGSDEDKQNLPILPFIYILTRGMFFAAPFVSLASTLAAYQIFIQLSLIGPVPPLLLNLFILQLFFLILSVPMSIFCISLFDKHRFATPAYNAILTGTVLVGLNSLGIGFLLILAGIFTYAINNVLKLHSQEKTDKF